MRSTAEQRERAWREHIVTALSCALPLWQVRTQGYDDATAQLRARAAGAIVAHYGDALQYGRGRNRGRNLIDLWVRQQQLDPGNLDAPWDGAPSPGEVFNALAEGLALAGRLQCCDPMQVAQRLLGEVH